MPVGIRRILGGGVQLHPSPLPSTQNHPLIQPMDQQLTANFKKLYRRELFWRCLDMTDRSSITLADYQKHHFDIEGCLQIIKIVWDSVSQKNLNASWRNL
ncbi:hypothetical protein JRQ81_002279 [Phrynocephalus forsythii]|uniref:DDE-1 domain-containing protein n=1 Tax=Phrynocephalus forsythii TaxID=171643 RepID=A0A9Q0XI24_9SAUR|nr:hypothetical protein JRQ81_002279 [Phrynocephalus forsythii]